MLHNSRTDLFQAREQLGSWNVLSHIVVGFVLDFLRLFSYYVNCIILRIIFQVDMKTTFENLFWTEHARVIVNQLKTLPKRLKTYQVTHDGRVYQKSLCRQGEKTSLININQQTWMQTFFLHSKIACSEPWLPQTFPMGWRCPWGRKEKSVCR